MGSGCNRDTGLRPGSALIIIIINYYFLVLWFGLAFGSENH